MANIEYVFKKIINLYRKNQKYFFIGHYFNSKIAVNIEVSGAIFK